MTNAILPAVQYLASLPSDLSRVGMTTSLNMIAKIVLDAKDKEFDRRGENQAWRSLDWQTLSPISAAAVRSKLTRAKAKGEKRPKYSPATINKALSAMRGIFKARMIAGTLTFEDHARALAALKPVKGERRPVGQEIAIDKFVSLVNACDAFKPNRRAMARAMLMIARFTGIRRSELLNAEYNQTCKSPDDAVLEYSITLLTKGNVERIVFVTGVAAVALKEWLDRRGKVKGGLFVAIDEFDRIGGARGVYRPMSTFPAYTMIETLRCATGMEELGWHDFRRTFGTDLMRKTKNIRLVQLAMGHKRVETTTLYDKSSDDLVREMFVLSSAFSAGEMPLSLVSGS